MRKERPITKYDLRVAKSKRHLDAQSKRWGKKYQRRPRICRGE